MINITDLRKNEKNDLHERLLSRNQLDRSDVMTRVAEILGNIKKNGDSALLSYTKMFDSVEMTAGKLKVTKEEIDKAYQLIDKALIDVIKKAKLNIEDYHKKQKENSWFTSEKEGIILGQVLRPLETVGVYVPGGTAALSSSVLMNIVPAKVAGVEKIVMITPPAKDGSVHPAILVAANEAGADEIYRAGGAQAVAALAYGTETIPRVDKIFGPGNIYVATAKRMVYGYCDIDMFAGPSEIAIIADETANPEYVAADLLSQAEHDILASAILVTTSESLAVKAQSEIERQAKLLPRRDIVEKSLESYGAIVIVNTIEEAAAIINQIAPEHLELSIKEPFELLGSIKNAGAIFLGHYAPEPLGDYMAGPNHVLPTSGTARFFSPLGVGDFVKKSSIISYSRNALEAIKDDITLFAEAEGLTAHANAIRARFGGIRNE